MRTPLLVVIMLPIAVLAGGCTSNQIIRSNVEPCSPASQGRIAAECRTSFIEHYHDESGHTYMLGFVEFDDQGWPHQSHRPDQDQMTALLDQVEREAIGKALVLFVFVHGWKHNCEVCDSNVGCVRDILRQIALVEGRFPEPRVVVGIYVGWRGLSLSGPRIWEDMSFYARKNAALHVAQGSVRELFARVRRLQTKLNQRKGNVTSTLRETRLMIVGHSFGGLIVYHAVSQFLIDSAAGNDDQLVEPYGDLVVLVNPAFEASRYEALHRIATGRKTYPPEQKPVFIAVTSENDLATKTAFPLGRRVNALFERFTNDEERRANLETLGHVERYRTHSLALYDETKADQAQRIAKRPPTCECPYVDEMRAMPRTDISREAAGFYQFNREWRDEGGHLKPRWRRRYSGGAELIREANGGSPDSPFWIVRADKRIINGHNDFYTPVFIDFMRQLYDDMQRRNW